MASNQIAVAPEQVDELRSPPKAPLAFRVGVVGHRPDRLVNADLDVLAQVIRGILQDVDTAVKQFAADDAGLFDGQPPALRAISPLAEGTDRIFAEQALALGWELCCVFPFAQEEFEKDFVTPQALEKDSLDRFRSILARARDRLTVFELDGSRDYAGAAYGAGGRVVLNQSDLLVVVWDGQHLGKKGGTEETLREAEQSGVPVIWVNAAAPHNWQWLGGTEPGRSVSEVVEGLLGLPEPKEKRRAASDIRLSLAAFYTERRPGWCLAFLWRLFRGIFGQGTIPLCSICVKPFEQAVLRDWPRDRSTPIAAAVDTLRPYYAWPDKLAVLYGDRFRSSFIHIYALSAAAVALALAHVTILVPSHAVMRVFSMLEVAAIASVIFVYLYSRKHRWHEKWLEFRLTAELVRHIRAVTPVGGGRPFPQMPAHQAGYGAPTSTWMGWYARAVSRKVSLPSAKVDRAYLRECLTALSELLRGQIGFHRNTERVSRNLEHRLELLTVVVLALTAIACLLHFFEIAATGPLVFLCAFLPAVAAGVAGISYHGEFRASAVRSRAMAEKLESLQNTVAELEQKVEASPHICGLSQEVRFVTQEAGEVLLNEVLDWRVIFINRPPSLG